MKIIWLLMLIFNPLIIASQTQLILGSFLSSVNAQESINKINKKIDEDTQFKNFFNNNHLNTSYTKNKKYFRVVIKPFNDVKTRRKVYRFLKSDFKDAYALKLPTAKKTEIITNETTQKDQNSSEKSSEPIVESSNKKKQTLNIKKTQSVKKVIYKEKKKIIAKTTAPAIPTTLKPEKKDNFPYIKPVSIEYVEIQPDSDGDHVFDKNDKCPDTKAGVLVDKLGCKIKTDLDADGIFDEDDECPNSTKGVEVDENGCEIDSDNDGIVDSQDECPDTNTDFFKVDENGCPKTATLKVQFEAYKYKIDDSVSNDIEIFANFLEENIGYKVIIYGYTDSSGDKFKNKLLSQYRANSVRKALINYGIDRKRLIAIGKGEQNPIADNSTAQGRSLNRRIEVELMK